MPEYKFTIDEKIDIKSRQCSALCPMFDWDMDEDRMCCKLTKISWKDDLARPFPCKLKHEMVGALIKTYDELLLTQHANGYKDTNQPETINELIDAMEKCRSRRDMTEESQGGHSVEASIGEFQYGVSHVPIRWVLQIIKEYRDMLESEGARVIHDQ